MYNKTVNIVEEQPNKIIVRSYFSRDKDFSHILTSERHFYILT